VTGRVVLVTGGNRGIGHAIAKRFATSGHPVAITSRSGHADDAANLLVVKADVTDPASVDQAVSEVEEKLGNVEVLVSNAGITKDGLILRMSDDEFTSVLDANLTGSFRVAKRVSKGMMRGRWGRMIFISSISGLGGQPGQANYSASKAGMIGMARTFAKEFSSRGITANVVCPGPIVTDMLMELTDEQRAAFENAVPVGRLGRPDEIAAAVEFLASESAGYITGTVLPIDGGLSMG